MKKPLFIGVSALILLAVSATLFAQTTTGSSLITQMKAAVHAFTLAGDLNPGTTGLESAPLVGKRTGDMLSAGEYNRILELVGQGGGGGGLKICKENDNCAGTPLLCGAASPDSRQVMSPDSNNNGPIIFGSWSNSQCGTSGTGWHTGVSSCSTATGTGFGKCEWVLVDTGGGGGGTGGGGGLKMCAGNDVSCQTSAIIGMKCEVLAGVNQGKFENPNQWHYSGVAMKVENGKWYGSFPEYQNAGHFANVACDRVVVYDPSLSGSGGGGGGFNWDQCTPEWIGTPKNGTPYTNAAGLKCKYTGASGPGALDNTYYLCCPGS